MSQEIHRSRRKERSRSILGDWGGRRRRAQETIVEKKPRGVVPLGRWSRGITTVMLELARSGRFRPIAMVFTIWEEMFGSGARTGTMPADFGAYCVALPG